MGIPRLEASDAGELQTKTNVFECPTGSFKITYRSESGAIADIVFEQTKDINGVLLTAPIRLPLSKYLPEKWVFSHGKLFGADSESRTIHFPDGGLELNKSLTILLHEIGHAVAYEHHREHGTYDAYSEQENSHIHERDAWANALVQIRALIKAGIIAEETWRSPVDLRNLVYSSLAAGDRGLDVRFTKGKYFTPVDLKDVEAVDDVVLNTKIDELIEQYRISAEELAKRMRDEGY